jgi:hypothetical protein
VSASDLTLVQELYEALARREAPAAFAPFDPEVRPMLKGAGSR